MKIKVKYEHCDAYILGGLFTRHGAATGAVMEQSRLARCHLLMGKNHFYERGKISSPCGGKEILRLPNLSWFVVGGALA